MNTPPALWREHLDPQARLYANRMDMVSVEFPVGVGAEVGTYQGEFAEVLLTRADQLHLFDRDFAPLREHRAWLADHAKVQLHRGDSPARMAALDPGSFDWVYIDGDHTEPGVRRDVAQAERLVAPDGVLAFHDYCLYSVLEDGWYGVVPVVNAVVTSGRWRMVAMALDVNGYYSVALRRS